MCQFVHQHLVHKGLRTSTGLVVETGSARETHHFALLAAYIAVQATVTLAGGSRPHRSTLGVIWLAVTVVAMWALAYGKHRTGTRLQNKALMTEARVTVIDGALAGAVLIGVALNAAFGWWWADPLSSLVILLYGVREARHAWQEAG